MTESKTCAGCLKPIDPRDVATMPAGTPHYGANYCPACLPKDARPDTWRNRKPYL